jgi:hypothetical protein
MDVCSSACAPLTDLAQDHGFNPAAAAQPGCPLPAAVHLCPPCCPPLAPLPAPPQDTELLVNQASQLTAQLQPTTPAQPPRPAPPAGLLAPAHLHAVLEAAEHLGPAGFLGLEDCVGMLCGLAASGAPLPALHAACGRVAGSRAT